ncbi:YhgE/Pip domain-containing protein [Periweissella fabalis]|uniref:YhgE/Pip domain-containing protein n=1 Tax=Periweissella fabalis TaxID=1070421 RepID=A0A7X6N252_9LACO|nr:YhgE/Pip domain-containing protein [Periweissella fabalis]MCM0599597.1 YhgE/Pip domain-containing protein [Periweissella fabalis]NKZ23902.1 YhgE/Pip domain-containing protein [Periweissella fabalis]
MKMIKSEFAAIKSNRVLMISLMAISFIPFLYCIFFLRSVWDPYGSTGNLPVAVVNEDRTAKFNGQEISAGQQLVDQLKHNKNLKWEFVSEKQAAEGIKDKKYYSIITIPEDFSKNATTLLDKNPKKMNLTYETNDSLNYIGSVISEQGAKAVNDKIKSAITEAYAKAMFAQVEKAGAGFQKAADGSGKLADGANQLNNGLKTYTGGVGQIGSGVNQLQQGVGPLSSGVNQLAGGAGQLANGLGQLQQNVGPLQAGVGQLANGSGQLVNGLGQLQQNVEPLQVGVGKLNSGASQLAGGLSQLNNRLPEAYNGSARLQQGLAQLQNAIKAQQVSSNNPKAPTLTDGIAGLQAGVKQLQAGLAGATLTDAQQGAIADLQKQITAVNGLAAAIQSAAKAVGISDEQTKALMQALQPEFAKMNAKVQEDMAIIKPTLDTLPTQLGALKNGIDKLGAGINQVGTGQASLLTQVNGGLTKLNNGASELNAGLAEAKNGVAKLAPGSQQLLAGTNQLNGKIPALAGGVNQLANGANQLNGGLGQLNSKVPALANGVNQLAGGANQLNGGLGQLNSKVPTLANGVNQLANGANQLTANSGKLLAGANQLSDGSGKLTLALKDGAKQINNVTFTNKTAKMFATPTQLDHKRYSYVPNYGHALAPYVLSLALYVGALVFNFIYPIRRRYELGGTTTGWFASKITIGGIVAIAMGVIEVALMYVGGIHPDHLFETFFMACLFALAAMYLVMFLAMTFDNPGRFLAMVLLMIQLGGAGGTFPVQVQSEFYKFVSPLLPMTYSVLGLRESLTSGLGGIQIVQSSVFLISVMIVSLGLLWLGMNHLQKKNLAGNWAEQEIKKEKDAAKA